jgi:hypothetical protein
MKFYVPEYCWDMLSTENVLLSHTMLVGLVVYLSAELIDMRTKFGQNTTVEETTIERTIQT